MKSVTFSEDSNLQCIKNDAFIDSTIQKLFLPASIEKLEDTTFAHTFDLIDIEISQTHKYFKYNDDQILISKDTILFANRDIETISFPQNVKRIGSFSFSNCKRLQSIVFNLNIIDEIGESAFISCSSLCEISLSSSLKRIEKKCICFL